MGSIKTTNLERENLEAHVDLCAERYSHLESRLTNIERAVNDIREDIQKNNSSMIKTIIAAAGSVVAALLSTAVAILIKF